MNVSTRRAVEGLSPAKNGLYSSKPSFFFCVLCLWGCLVELVKRNNDLTVFRCAISSSRGLLCNPTAVMSEYRLSDSTDDRKAICFSQSDSCLPTCSFLFFFLYPLAIVEKALDQVFDCIIEHAFC